MVSGETLGGAARVEDPFRDVRPRDLDSSPPASFITQVSTQAHQNFATSAHNCISACAPSDGELSRRSILETGHLGRVAGFSGNSTGDVRACTFARARSHTSRLTNGFREPDRRKGTCQMSGYISECELGHLVEGGSRPDARAIIRGYFARVPRELYTSMTRSRATVYGCHVPTQQRRPAMAQVSRITCIAQKNWSTSQVARPPQEHGGVRS